MEATPAAEETAARGTAAPPAPRPVPEVLDLAAAGREGVLRRVAPVLAALLALIVLRRRR